MRLNFSLFSLASYRINNFKSRTYIVFAFLAVLFFGFPLFIKHLHKARTNEVVEYVGSSIIPTFGYNSCLWSWSDLVNAPALFSIFISIFIFALGLGCIISLARSLIRQKT